MFESIMIKLGLRDNAMPRRMEKARLASCEVEARRKADEARRKEEAARRRRGGDSLYGYSAVERKLRALPGM